MLVFIVKLLTLDWRAIQTLPSHGLLRHYPLAFQHQSYSVPAVYAIRVTRMVNVQDVVTMALNVQ